MEVYRAIHMSGKWFVVNFEFPEDNEDGEVQNLHDLLGSGDTVVLSGDLDILKEFLGDGDDDPIELVEP